MTPWLWEQMFLRVEAGRADSLAAAGVGEGGVFHLILLVGTHALKEAGARDRKVDPVAL